MLYSRFNQALNLMRCSSNVGSWNCYSSHGKRRLSPDDDQWSSQVRITVRWGDMDSYGHVNNAVYLKFFEDARLHFMSEIGFTGKSDHESVILSESTCKYIRPLFFPDILTVKIRTADLGTNYWTMEGIVCADSLKGDIAAYGTAKLYFYDYLKSQKIDVPSRIREYLETQMKKISS